MAKKTEGTNVKFNGISFRLSEAERRIINKNADKAGLTPSLYAKKQALEGKLKIMFSDKIGQEIISSLVRIENNFKEIDNTMNNSVESQFNKIQDDLDIIMDFIFLQKKPKKEKSSEKIPQICTEIFQNETQTENTIEIDEKLNASVKVANSSKNELAKGTTSNIVFKYMPPDVLDSCCDYCGHTLIVKYNKTKNNAIYCCPKGYRDKENGLNHSCGVINPWIANTYPGDWMDWDEDINDSL